VINVENPTEYGELAISMTVARSREGVSLTGRFWIRIQELTEYQKAFGVINPPVGLF